MTDGYFEWLKTIVDPVPYAGQHDFLLRTLFEMSFYSLIPLDRNRAKDGLDLREEFYGYIPPDPYFPNMHSGDMIIDTECTVLEALIGIARRANFIIANFTEDLTCDLFWEFLGNADLGFDDMFDNKWNERTKDFVIGKVGDILERKFRPNGVGGLFPLQNPKTDQRNQEIWNQMNAYLSEKNNMEEY